MKRTAIYLDEDVQRVLLRQAKTEGRTQSAVIRDAVLSYAGRDIPKAKCVGLGKWGRHFARRSEEILKPANFVRR